MDDNPLTDVKERIAKAMQTSGKMRHIWSSKPLHLKASVYHCRSLFTTDIRIGSVAPERTDDGANNRLLHRITGKSIKEEASLNTRTFDLVRWIWSR